MIKILINGKDVIFAGKEIDYGFWEMSPDRYKWRCVREDNSIIYALDINRDAKNKSDCLMDVIEVESLPEDFYNNLYFYIDGKFVKLEQPKTLEEKVADVEQDILELASIQADILYEMACSDLGLEE